MDNLEKFFEKVYRLSKLKEEQSFSFISAVIDCDVIIPKYTITILFTDFVLTESIPKKQELSMGKKYQIAILKVILFGILIRNVLATKKLLMKRVIQ